MGPRGPLKSASGEMDHRITPVLFISVLGGIDISIAGKSVPLSNRKARAMLAYLAFTESGRERRERIAGLLWPDSSEQNARASLRQVVVDVRDALEVLGCSAVITNRDEIALRPGAFDVDLKKTLREIVAGRTPESLQLRPRAAETLLAGFEDLSPLLHDWITGLRSSLQEQLIHALELSWGSETVSRLQRRRLAETALLLDPLHEEACRIVMRLAAEDGEIGPALRVYSRLYDALGDELDMEPSSATRELVAEIKQGLLLGHQPISNKASGRVEPGPEAPHSGAPVVAIMPFRALGPDPVAPFIIDGLLEDIVRALTGLREPVVISSNSTRSFREATDIHAIGRELNARYVVSGTIRASSSRIRLATELVEIATRAVLWAGAYDLTTPTVFEAQDDITASIASTLVPRLQESELRQSHGQSIDDLTAYRLLLRARELVFRLDRAAADEAGNLLREALKRDPGYAALHAAMADWYSIRLGQGWSAAPDDDMQSLERLARSAIALDPSNGRALAMLAHNRTIFRREYREAMDLIERAAEASPNDAEALMWSSPTYAFAGDAVGAVKRAERAISLSPYDPFLFRYEHFLSIAHYAAGTYDEAAHWGLRSMRSNPQYTSNLRLTAAALVAVGRSAEARAIANKVAELEPEFRVGPMIDRQAFRDPEVRARFGRQMVEAGLPP
jgi:DNA-binding SARP family transcriptional activator/Tfp pilus assembly protein PilF